MSVPCTTATPGEVFRLVPPLLWTQKQDVGPRPRVDASATFDSGRGRVVLFGGAAPPSAAFADTWEWDGEDWTQIADTGPDARSGHALTFDDKRGRVVLFGGLAADTTLRDDTWEWDGENWTQMADTGPGARAGHGLAFDSGRSVTVLFGGGASGPGLRADTWAWDGAAWTQEEDTGPSARQGHALAFDRTHAQVVLYGGDAGAVMGDTWTFDGEEWTERSDFGPPACVGANMVSDGSSLLLYGGAASRVDAAAVVFSGAWQWDGRHWTQRQDIRPGPRWGHAMAFDSRRGCAVIYGGASTTPAAAAQVRGDTWEEQGAPMAEPPVAGEQGPPVAEPPVAGEHGLPVVEPGIRMTAFRVDPPSGSADQPAILEVTLDRPAPAGGVTVTLRTDNGHIALGTLPLAGEILVNAGITTGQSGLWVSPVARPGVANLSASLGEQVMTFPFMIV